jgi:hypothetical protein
LISTPIHSNYTCLYIILYYLRASASSAGDLISTPIHSNYTYLYIILYYLRASALSAGDLISTPFTQTTPVFILFCIICGHLRYLRETAFALHYTANHRVLLPLGRVKSKTIPISINSYTP